MSATPRTLLHDGGPEVGAEGDGVNPRCHWTEDVCTDTPTHYIVYGPSDDAEACTYCPRHQILTLAWLLELHLPHCPGSLADHILDVGELGAGNGSA